MKTCTLLTTLLLTALATAQDVRDLSTPTGHGRHYGVTAAAITSYINAGNRLTDIEVESVSPLRFNATYTANNGAYQSGFWWYYGLTSAQLATNLSNNNGRLVDLEAYDDGNGNTRFACVMVPNTGANQKSWWYYYGATPTDVATAISTHNGRLVDLDSYTINGTTRYVAVMIHNSGADYRQYYWYYNSTPATINTSQQQHGTRLFCLNRRDNGNFDAVLVDEAASPAWTWWYGLDAAGVSERLGNYGHRLLNLDTYFESGQRRFAILTINNSNALTTQVGQLMRSQTDGTIGAYLRQLSGSELAGLNERRVFEPASTMKTLHHVHAMRQVAMGFANLQTPLTVYTNYASPTSSCPVDTGAIVEPLSTVLRRMMENSDNARTQAVRAYFGEPAINATASLLNMDDTELRHRIGCGNDAVTNPNDITLYDLGLLHQQVSQGWLGSYRDEFYELMLNGLTWGGISSVIDQEAALLGLTASAVTSFKARVELARKGGSYTLNGAEYRSGFGWIEIPFLVGNQVLPREYVVGAFVHAASDGTSASNAVSQAVGEMLRPTLRAALTTWDVVAASASYGASCARMSHTTPNLPVLGQNAVFRASSANAASLAVLSFGFQTQNLDLSRYGFPGCTVYTDMVANETTVADVAGEANVSVSIPNSTSWLGTEFYTQYFSFGPSFKVSNGRHNVVGW